MKDWGREIHGPSQGAEVAARLARRHFRPTARLRLWKVPALRPPGPRRFGRPSAPAYLPGPVQVHLPLAGSRYPLPCFDSQRPPRGSNLLILPLSWGAILPRQVYCPV